MAEEREESIVGGLIGAAIGNYQGTMVGGAAAFAIMALPLTGFLAILAIPAVFALPVAGAIGGTYVGAKVGSEGLDQAAMMLLGQSLGKPDGGPG